MSLKALVEQATAAAASSGTSPSYGLTRPFHLGPKLTVLSKIACLVLALVATQVAAQSLRTAAQDSAPKYFLGDDGNMSGIGHDVMRAIERLEPGIQFTGGQSLVPMKRIEVMLERGDLDVFFGYHYCPVKS